MLNILNSFRDKNRIERDRLIAEYEKLGEKLRSGARDKTLDIKERFALADEREQTLLSYYNSLPRLPVSRCPFCKAPLNHVFDPWGLDGYWWQEEETVEYEEAPACPHFALLSGAVAFNNAPVRGGPISEAFTGPEVPYIISRILKMRGMKAVISSVPMSCGYTAYPVAYFSLKAPKPGTLSNTWRQTSYTWEDNEEDYAWNVCNDPWDFDLRPWIMKKRVLWIAPDDADLTLISGSPDKCPYLDLDGRREAVYVLGNTIRTQAPPDGNDCDDAADLFET